MRPTTLLPLLLSACAASTTEPDDTGAPEDTGDSDLLDPADRDGDGNVSDAERVASLTAPGPWRVGARLGSLTYDDEVGGTQRTLRWTAWYPTDATTGSTTSFAGSSAPEDVLDDPAVAEGTFPVAIFSHGHQGNMDNCATVAAHLSSHGWVVLAPEHTGNTLTDFGPRTTELYVQRPFDISAMLDELTSLPELSEHVTDDVFAFGHSFGGYTTFLLAGGTWDVDRWSGLCGSADPLADTDFCSTWTEDLAATMRQGAADDRIVAAASLSGGNLGQLGAAGIGAIDRPFLQVSGGVDASVSNASESDPIWAAMPAGTMRVDIAHGDHFTYTGFAGTSLPGSSPEALDAERGHDLVHAYVLAFAQARVLGQLGLEGVLDGSISVDDDATVSTK